LAKKSANNNTSFSLNENTINATSTSGGSSSGSKLSSSALAEVNNFLILFMFDD
jgi:hypothetical protein